MRCKECEQCFSGMAELTEHRAQPHDATPPVATTEKKQSQLPANCGGCGKGFSSELTIIRHQRTRESTPSILIAESILLRTLPGACKGSVCKDCDQTFSTVIALQKHLQDEHDGTAESPTCGSRIDSSIKKTSLGTKKSECASSKGPEAGTQRSSPSLACHDCGTTFASLGLLNSHRNRSTLIPEDLFGICC